MLSDRDVVIVDCIRSPLARGYSNGKLHNFHPVDLLALLLDELTKRTGINKKDVEDVICGCVTPVAEQGGNIGRLAVLKAGFPDSVPGIQLDRMCGSGQQAIHFASQAIASGDMDIVIACGVEMMSRVPMGSSMIGGDPDRNDEFRKNFPYKLISQGLSAELVAEKWNISRESMEKFAGASHEKAADAAKKGLFKKEIMPLSVVKEDGSRSVMDSDEGIRVPVDYKKLSTLKTIFKQDGVITAAMASQISDGASAVLLMSAAKAKSLGLKPRARIVARAVVGTDPILMLSGPIPATLKVLEKANMKLDQIDRFEINEAFASVVLAWMKELKVNPDKVNVNGGAIAHGHPLGATGCVLMTKLVNELERSGKRFGLQSMCIGWGMGTATIIENLSAPKSKL